MPGDDGLPEFLHATSNPHGERTASLDVEFGKDEFYQNGVFARVRFTLNADDFEQWLTVVRRYPEWTPEKIKNLENIGHKLGVSPYSWYARAEPLSLDKVVAVHTRTAAERGWRPFDLATAQTLQIEGMPNAMGVVIGEHWYCSESYVNPDGNHGFRFKRPFPVEALQSAA
jgi:hypothetical protein